MTKVEEYLQGTIGLTSSQWYAADFDRNGVVNNSDKDLLEWHMYHMDTITKEHDIDFS